MAKQKDASFAVDLVSRVLAILLLFIGLPTYGGVLLDRYFGTIWLTPLAVMLGTLLGILGLILVLKKIELSEKESSPKRYKTEEELERQEEAWREGE